MFSFFNAREYLSGYMDWVLVQAHFFAWAESVLSEGKIVAIEEAMPIGAVSFYVRGSGKAKKKFRKKILLDKNTHVAVILCRAGCLTSVLRSFYSTSLPSDQKKWTPLFRSSFCEVWCLPAFLKSGALPVHLSISTEEKHFLLQLAREVITKFLLTETRETAQIATTYPLLNRIASVDVALWVKGSLRGSIIKVNRPLIEGIIDAAIGATRDSRFKPVSSSELRDTRIAVTIFSDLRLPLTRWEIEKNTIYTEKGYRLVSGSAQGWYLPQVFNAVRFSNLEDFLEKLATNKAGIRRYAWGKSLVTVFEVADFAESLENDLILEMKGPLVTRRLSRSGLQKSNNTLMVGARNAADWLCGLQLPDGFIPAIVSKAGEEINSFDPPRMFFVAWALAEFGVRTKTATCQEAARRLLSYGQKYLSQVAISHENRILALAYMGKSYLALEDVKQALFRVEDIVPLIAGGHMHGPIPMLQTAGFFMSLPDKAQNGYFVIGKKIFEQTLEKFWRAVEKGIPVSLAAYAELIPILYTLTHNDEKHSSDTTVAMKTIYTRTVKWYTDQQKASGAFPNTQFSDFMYTRGTSKVFEVLSVDTNNKVAVFRAAEWLMNMQFTPEAFFIPEKARKSLLGGFRHDLLNSDAWIDAAGHILIGAARLYTRSELS